MRPGTASHGARPRSRPASRRSGAIRSVLLAAAGGGLLAAAALAAVSCQSPARLVPVDSASRERAAEAPVSVAPADTGVVREEPLVRVRIRRGVGRASLDQPGAWVVAPAGARVGEVISGPVRVLASGGGIRLMDSSGRVTGFPPGAAVFAAPRQAADGGGTVRIDGDTYPGTLRLVPDPGARTFDAVNVVDIEDYLPGVISRELMPTWSDAAFRVQAVAARTFALQRRERARRAGRHFDLESTTADQVYGGSTGMAVAHDAVAATRGVVLIDGATLGTAYYSSTCGGRPALAEEIWPAGEPSTGQTDAAQRPDQPDAGRDVLCQASPLFRWTAIRRTGELADRIAAWAEANRISPLATLRSIADIRPVAHSASGRPVRYLIADARGASTVLTGEQLRSACNASAAGLPALTRTNRVHSNDLEFDVGRRTVTIRGRGFGHGVGMCQYCAEGMAERGDHWRDILGAFYPRYDVRRVY